MPGIYPRSSKFQKAWTLSAIHSTCSVVVSDQLCSTLLLSLVARSLLQAVYIHHFWNLSRASIAATPAQPLSMAPSTLGFCSAEAAPSLIGLPDLSVLSLCTYDGPLMPLKVIPPGRLFAISKFNCQYKIQL